MKMMVVLVVVAVMVGGGAGGALIVATTLGGDDAADATAASFPTPRSSDSQATAVQPGQAQDAGPGLDLSQLQGLRDRLASGDATEEELAQLRQQFQDLGGFGGAPGAQGRLGGGFGTIDNIDGVTLTVTTAQGALSATVGDETTIRITSEGGADSLGVGMQVSVVGDRDDAGVLVASVITVVPESGGGLGSGQIRQFPGGRARGGLGVGRGPGGGGFGADRALTGTIQSIDNGALTVETSQGPLVVAVRPDTVVRLTVPGGIDDLEAGMNVVVGGQPAEDGPMAATSITVVPEGADGQLRFGADSFSGGSR